MRKKQFFNFHKVIPKNVIQSLSNKHIRNIKHEAVDNPIVKDVCYAVMILHKTEADNWNQVVEAMSAPTFISRLKLLE